MRFVVSSNMPAAAAEFFRRPAERVEVDGEPAWLVDGDAEAGGLPWTIAETCGWAPRLVTDDPSAALEFALAVLDREHKIRESVLQLLRRSCAGEAVEAAAEDLEIRFWAGYWFAQLADSLGLSDDEPAAALVDHIRRVAEARSVHPKTLRPARRLAG